MTDGTFRPDASGNQYHNLELIKKDFACTVANGMNSVRVYNTPPRGRVSWQTNSEGALTDLEPRETRFKIDTAPHMTRRAGEDAKLALPSRIALLKRSLLHK